MSSRYRFSIAVSCTLGLWILTSGGAAPAQFPGRPPVQPARVDISGTIEAMVPGYLKVKTAADQSWTLQIARNAKILVTGKATVGFLSTGHFVSFVADVDKRRSKVEEKVSKLTIFTPSPERAMGAFPGGMGGAEGGLGPNPFGPGPGFQQPPAGGPNAGPPVESYEIVGRIASMKKGKVTVYVPNPFFKPALQIELAEEVDIDLDLAGPALYSLAKQGDKIEARGIQVRETAAQVNEVTIELAEPLGPPQKKRPVRPPRVTRPKTPVEPREGFEVKEDPEKPAEEDEPEKNK